MKRRSHLNDTDRELLAAGLELVRLQHLIDLGENIVAALDDLNAKLAALAGLTQNVVERVNQLEAAQGVPADQVSDAAAKLQPILDQLQAALQ